MSKKKIFSKRADELSLSPTLAFDAKVRMLQKKGKEVLNLTLGEPDFATPEYIQDAAIGAITSGFTHYTLVGGIEELRKAISKKLRKENNIRYDSSEIIVGAGTKFLLYELFQVLLDKGDEVILSLPTWSTYVEQIKLAEGKPVTIKLMPPFQLTAEAVEKKLSKKTKIILLNSPANPTGAIISKKELQNIVRLAKKHKLYIISDEIYEKITYGAKFVSPASLLTSMREHILTVNGFSKAYAMTGWRLGYVAGSQEIIAKMNALQSQTTSNATSISQKAGVTALTGPQQSIKDMVKEFTRRQNYLVKEFLTIPNLSFTPPEGAFYLFVSVERMLGKKFPSSEAWCRRLLEEEGVPVIPGEAFYYPGYFRLSFASSMEILEKATEKIRRFCKRYA
ncbi:MAG: pyridoxal phosphate-dependent aminotransferase [Candidatus Levybacteria bacterium]|nr:pyridoxal phosphate-dependent aminotransferase [Candidatus Levybacteria bacterium]